MIWLWRIFGISAYLCLATGLIWSGKIGGDSHSQTAVLAPQVLELVEDSEDTQRASILRDLEFGRKGDIGIQLALRVFEGRDPEMVVEWVAQESPEAVQVTIEIDNQPVLEFTRPDFRAEESLVLADDSFLIMAKKTLAIAKTGKQSVRVQAESRDEFFFEHSPVLIWGQLDENLAEVGDFDKTPTLVLLGGCLTAFTHLVFSLLYLLVPLMDPLPNDEFMA